LLREYAKPTNSINLLRLQFSFFIFINIYNMCYGLTTKLIYL